MAEYIEREALLKYPIRANRCDKENANEHFIYGIESVMEYAESLPAADVVEVVRCNDCKSFGIYQCSGNGYCTHDKGLIDTEPDDFCSYGERRDTDGF